MWALIGLLAGAAAGSLIGHDWGAVLGGLAGFFVGAVFSGSRQLAAFRKPEGTAGSGPPMITATPSLPAHDPALAWRVAELERRVAQLEGARHGPADAAASALPGEPVGAAGASVAVAPPASVEGAGIGLVGETDSTQARMGRSW